MGTTETVTVLFTDVVDSTGLRVRLGDEIADNLRAGLERALARAVDASHGRVVKGVGDGVMAVFDAAAEAVAAAVLVQQRVEERNHRLPEPVGLRVGLAAGDVTVDGGDYHGLVVVEAARLCDECDRGQILASETVRLLAGARGGAEFAPVGERALRGLPAPVAVVEVCWEPSPRAGLPAGLARRGDLPFVGRRKERRQLAEAWKRATAGDGGLVLVAGDPGVGKTRLVAELARDVHGDGATVVYGRCDEDLVVAYQPFVQALDAVVASLTPDEVGGHVERHGGELARISRELSRRVPEAPAPVTGDDPDQDRWHLFEAARDVLVTAAASVPLLVLLDDLHWAAKPGLLLLRHLVRPAGPAPVLLVGTYRETELDRAHPLAGVLADLRRDAGVERVRLSGLDAEEVAGLLTLAAGHDLPEAGADLARALHAQTEGNPFFVGELLRHLAQSGAIFQRDGRWTAGLSLERLGLPEGVREVVGHRLSRLSGDANLVLAVAAVAGHEVDLDVLAAAMAQAHPDVAVVGGLEEAVAANLLEEDGEALGRYRFTHALVRQTLDQELSSARRALIHRQVGGAIEAVHAANVDAHVAALAHHHLEAARAGDTALAVDYTRRAAEQALREGAWETAVPLIERGLEVVALDPSADAVGRGELYLLLARAHFAHMDTSSAQTAAQAGLEALRGRAAPRLVARLVVYIGQGQWWRLDPALIGLAEEALAVIGDDDAAARSLVLSHLTSLRATAGEGMRLDAASRENLATAAATGDAEALLWATLARWQVMMGSARVAELLELFDAAERLQRHQSFVVERFDAMIALPLLRLGDRQGFERERAVALDAARARRTTSTLALVIQWDAMLALLDGRLDEVESLASEVLGVTRDPIFNMGYSAQIAALRYEQGRGHEVLDMIDSLAASNPGLAIARANADLMLAEAGRHRDARAGFDSLVADGLAAVAPDWLYPGTLAALAATGALLGATDSAALLRERLLPYAGQLLVPGGGYHVVGAADRFIGMLDALVGDVDTAEQRLAAAAELEERVSSPPLLARTRYWHAWALLRRGTDADRRRARTLLAAAIDTAAAIGQAGVERDARHLLDSL